MDLGNSPRTMAVAIGALKVESKHNDIIHRTCETLSYNQQLCK